MEHLFITLAVVLFFIVATWGAYRSGRDAGFTQAKSQYPRMEEGKIHFDIASMVYEKKAGFQKSRLVGYDVYIQSGLVRLTEDSIKLWAEKVFNAPAITGDTVVVTEAPRD